MPKKSTDPTVCNLEPHEPVVNHCKIPNLTTTGPVEAHTQFIFPKEPQDEEPADGPTGAATPAKKRKTKKGHLKTFAR